MNLFRSYMHFCEKPHPPLRSYFGLLKPFYQLMSSIHFQIKVLCRSIYNILRHFELTYNKIKCCDCFPIHRCRWRQYSIVRNTVYCVRHVSQDFIYRAYKESVYFWLKREEKGSSAPWTALITELIWLVRVSKIWWSACSIKTLWNISTKLFFFCCRPQTVKQAAPPCHCLFQNHA